MGKGQPGRHIKIAVMHIVMVVMLSHNEFRNLYQNAKEGIL